MAVSASRRGRTPLIDLTEALGGRMRVLAKVEGTPEGGSIKDRTVECMVMHAMREHPDISTVIEASSGNTAVSLASAVRKLGTGALLFVPGGSGIKVQRARELGAVVVETPAGEGTAGAQRMAEEAARNIAGSLYLRQHSNIANPMAHVRTTGPEILRQAGPPDLLVAGIGTGGTLAGLRDFFSGYGTVSAGVCPEMGTEIPGLRRLDPAGVPIHGRITSLPLLEVDPDLAEWWRKRVRRMAGVDAGPSSGAAAAAAAELARGCSGGIAVVVFPDHGRNYS